MPKQRAGAQRRREIAQAAGELFADRGIHATTVRDIGERVGIQSGSLYHHFKTKHDIAHELMRCYGEDLLARYREAEAGGGGAGEKLERLFRACIRANLAHPNETAILIHELDKLFRLEEFSYIQRLVADVETLFVGVIAEGMHRGEIRTDIAPAFTYRMMMDVMGAVQRWYDPDKHSEDQVVRGWIDVFFRGIGAG